MSLIEQYKSEIDRMQEVGMPMQTIVKEISFALQHISKSTKLQECSQASKRAAIVNIANIGLTLNPVAKEAYLIPRWQNGGNECCLEPSYVGLVKLLTDSGSVKSVICNLVYAGDFFEMDLANNQNPVIHKPELTRSKKGDVIGAYALATLPDNNRQVEWMDAEELLSIRERSETYKAWVAKKVKSCTWVTDEGEMMRKTVIKRIYKYLPRTDRMSYIDNAIQVDNEDYKISDTQVDFIHTLLETSTLDHEQRSFIEQELNFASGARASEIIDNLKLNQQDRVTMGSGFNQGDIKGHLNQLS